MTYIWDLEICRYPPINLKHEAQHVSETQNVADIFQSSQNIKHVVVGLSVALGWLLLVGWLLWVRSYDLVNIGLLLLIGRLMWLIVVAWLLWVGYCSLVAVGQLLWIYYNWLVGCFGLVAMCQLLWISCCGPINYFLTLSFAFFLGSKGW